MSLLRRRGIAANVAPAAPEEATYFTDFSGYTVASGVPSGFTNRWAFGSWSIRESAIDSTVVLAEIDAGNAPRLLSWDTLGTVADIELAGTVRARNGTTGFRNAMMARCAGNNTTKEGYILELLDGDSLQLRKYDLLYASETLTTVAFTWSADTWYWLRFRVNGTQLQGKAWAVGDAEPGSWMISATDSDHASGWGGVGHFTGGSVNNREYGVLGASVGGGTAPMASA